MITLTAADSSPICTETEQDADLPWRPSDMMRDDRFSARTYDAGGDLSGDKLSEVASILAAFGAVHIQRTGLTDADALRARMPHIGFSPEEQFTGGGRTSANHQRKWAAPGLRRLDYYPPHLYLLPNNEVQYQRCAPTRVLFFCQRPPMVGGRAFLHSAADVEASLRAAGSVGQGLLDRIARHGLMIETGFLDQHDPRKPQNYFQSWQERFANADPDQTPDPDRALATALARTLEYDACWWREEDGVAPDGRPLRTLMTRITLTPFKRDPLTGRRYLRFPRIAFDAPSAQNGYRRFPLGDGSPLSADEIALLRAVYLATRQGTRWRQGDIILFDNMRFGHSREPFEGACEVLVGMAGTLWDDATDEAAQAAVLARLTPPPPITRCAQPPSYPRRYEVPPAAVAKTLRFSGRTFDAEGCITDAHFPVIREQLARYGAVHVQRTGLRVEHGGALPEEIRHALGFGDEAAFAWGGMSSGRTTRRALSRALRATDDYPPPLWLLPHNEILYQRHLPARLLFFSALAGPPAQAGRTFVHCAALMEAWLLRQGAQGEAVVNTLRRQGLRIDMGFLDERHPDKDKNYFRAWQDRFETTDRAEAEARCRASTTQFDDCWWIEEPVEGGALCHTLMTRIDIPGAHCDPVSGESRLMFPRVALDAPALLNGYRSYPWGGGQEMKDGELDLLLSAFLVTREGVHWGEGDILLVDNMRYGHSREAFEGRRSIGVAMAGVVETTP